MKKSIVIIIISAIILSFGVISVNGTVFAEETEEGFELEGDKKVEIIFGNFNLSSGGVVRNFTVTFDMDYLSNFNEETMFDKESLLNYIKTFMMAIGYEPEVDENGRVKGQMQYDSVTDLYLDYGKDGYETEEATEMEAVESIFFTEFYSRQKTIFDKIENNDGSLNMILEILYMYDIQKDDIALSYHYGTPYKIISSDAEESYYDPNNRIYVHEFNMNVNNADREILLVQKVPNTINWYLLGILITVPIIIISVLTGIYYKRKERIRRD